MITNGKDDCIQVTLYLANSKNLGYFRVTYNLVFMVGNKKRACYETKCVLESEKYFQHSCSERFINAFHLIVCVLQESNDISFVCNMQIQAVQVLNKSSIQSDYEKLFNDTKYSDFMVITSTKKFNVHKNIISARSEVFSAMFEHNMKETKKALQKSKILMMK